MAAAIATKLRERDEEIARACELANNSADVRLIETSFDALADEADTVQEPWSSFGGVKYGGFVWIPRWAPKSRRHDPA